MAINFKIDDIVGIKVKGHLVDANGNPQPYEFKLTCRRLNSEQITAAHANEITIGQFLANVVEDWSGPRDEQGQPVPYTPAALEHILKIPGIAKKAYENYLRSAGDVEKN